ncbi:MAG: AAHS family 4-hydroxybenzoate transporter-like MFS transporter [Paraglaciecola sp.]|jgi:AAHS family 4-hydroxybenzoate transporter-like MFS transporter
MHILVIVLCMMTNMLDGFNITAMAVVANSVGSEMNIPSEQLDFVLCFSLAGWMFLASLSDIFGRRKVIIISLAAVGASVLLTTYTTNLVELVTLRFISELGAGAMLASQATLTSEYSPDKYHGRIMTIDVFCQHFADVKLRFRQ